MNNLKTGNYYFSIGFPNLQMFPSNFFSKVNQYYRCSVPRLGECNNIPITYTLRSVCGDMCWVWFLIGTQIPQCLYIDSMTHNHINIVSRSEFYKTRSLVVTTILLWVCVFGMLATQSIAYGYCLISSAISMPAEIITISAISYFVKPLFYNEDREFALRLVIPCYNAGVI